MGAVRVTTSQPSAALVDRVRRLLVYEGAAVACADACAIAAERVHDKITARLSPILGSAGVRALFVRSARLVRGQLAALTDGAARDGSFDFRALLRAGDPTMSRETVEALFARFLALMTSFIGERLTTETLHAAWPTIEEPAPPSDKS